jgi:hypothetical protein
MLFVIHSTTLNIVKPNKVGNKPFFTLLNALLFFNFIAKEPIEREMESWLTMSV